MIIKGHRDSDRGFLIMPVLVTLLILLVFLRFYVPTISTEASIEEREPVFCGAETVDGEFFINGAFRFNNAHTRSDEKVLSGQYASKIDTNEREGFGYIMTDPRTGRRYRVSVWSFNEHPVDAYLAVSAMDSSIYYMETNETVERNGAYWYRRTLEFTVPENPQIGYLKIFVYRASGQSPIFFDDLEIDELPAAVFRDTLDFSPAVLELILDKKALDYIRIMKEKSIARGLVYHDDSKVKVKIIDDKKEKNAELRLKGDWLDHAGKYPSFRLDMSDTESWLGMQSFSVQEPRTRSFLREWVYFRFLDVADVLHPRHDFMTLKTNTDIGIVFSFEEHFTKNLVEHGKRREGPIIKLTEERYWEAQRRTMKSFRGNLAGPDEKDKSFWSSEIRPFKANKLLRNPALKNNFEAAQDLMHNFKYDLEPPEKIFDLDRLARYLAITDICLAEHAITWHNQRFYYNPVTDFLEPIAFDAYGEEDPKNYASDIYGEKVYQSNDSPYEPIDQLFFNDAFAKLYFKYLNYYSSQAFVVPFMESLESGIKDREHFLNIRFSDYSYDRTEIMKKAKMIQNALPAYENSLLAFEDEYDVETRTIKLHNTHSFPLWVYLKGKREEGVVLYPRDRQKEPEYFTYIIPRGVQSFAYEVLGQDSVYSAQIQAWPFPRSNFNRLDRINGNLGDFNSVLEQMKNQVVFHEGQHQINTPLIIPKDHNVVIKAGTELIFGKKGCVISHSPVRILGEEDNPVVIRSIDGLSGSFTVLQAGGKSFLRDVRFEHLNTLTDEHWQLTGGVNFYESDVDLVRVSFIDSQCEDALNIIRSSFSLNFCAFVNTFGDALDVDFSSGTIDNSVFRQCGNDAMDMSGSVVRIAGSKIDGAGDKGVSVGEQSQVTFEFGSISDAPIAMASKDLSKLSVNHATIIRCKTGFAAFQKKPEFGPAEIELFEFTLKDVERPFMTEAGSAIINNVQ